MFAIEGITVSEHNNFFRYTSDWVTKKYLDHAANEKDISLKIHSCQLQLQQKVFKYVKEVGLIQLTKSNDQHSSNINNKYILISDNT